jgi:hypothetical protein
MGIDLGYKIPLAWAVTNESYTSGTIGSEDEIKEERKKIVTEFNHRIAAIAKAVAVRGVQESHLF